MTDFALIVALVADVYLLVMLIRAQWKLRSEVADVGLATFCLVFLGTSLDEQSVANAVGISLLGAALVSSGYFLGFQANEDKGARFGARRWLDHAMPYVRAGFVLQIVFVFVRRWFPGEFMVTALAWVSIAAWAIVAVVLARERKGKGRT